MNLATISVFTEECCIEIATCNDVVSGVMPWLECNL